jgi:hypothetical protein
MTDNFEAPNTGIARASEASRTQEFRTRRDGLVAGVNGWLAGMARQRDELEPMADGLTITDEPRITRELWGRTGRGRMFSAALRPGVSLTGDGEATPYEFQSVRPRSDGTTDVITVRGSDPVAAAVSGEEYSGDREREEIASFEVQSLQSEGPERSFGFRVYGDGRVQRRFVTDHGVNMGMPLNRAEDLTLAEQAFDQVRDEVV